MPWLPSLAAELAITASSPEVWVSIGEALLFATVSLLFGTWVSRTVGLLKSDAPAGETLSVGLASGLMVLAAWWAAIWSGGRSSFTPVAIGFGVAILLAVARRARRRAAADAPAPTAEEPAGDAIPTRSPLRRSLVLSSLAGAVFIVAVALLYGSTMAPSPRDRAQPVERTDLAFYAVLGNDLATTGTETNTLPSGFSDLPGVPAQTWYHWGELWLASAMITIFGAAPMPARYLVVLPVLLLAAAAMTGTLVRRLNGTASRPAFLFGFLACLVLAPIPLISGPFFSVWAAGLIFGITVFGLAAVAVLFALYCVAVLGTRSPTWPLACFVGSSVAFIPPAHVVIALLALVGAVSVWSIRIGQSLLKTHRPPDVPPTWRRAFIATAVALLTTVAWGLLTDHGLGGGDGGSPARLSPFNASWRDTVAIVTLGAGVLLAIPLAWLLARRDSPLLADIGVGTMVILLAGAIAWGWRLATFNMFYFFFGAILVFAAPVAVVAAWLLVGRLRTAQHPILAVGVIVLCAIQLELGLVIGFTRIQGGEGVYDPIPVSLLHAIGQLPADAKLAYACQEFEEISLVNSKLLSISAHTGRRVVPMCFEADVNGPLLGTEPCAQIPDAGFASAPQAALYPDSTAQPSSAAVAAFLKAHGIDYIYADAAHPNTLVVDAVPVATSGGFELLRVP